MYILNKTLYNQQIQEIHTTNEELQKIQETISTGKQINRPSDNPEGTRQVLNYRTILSSINQYSNNIDFALNWCQATTNTLEATENLLSQCRDIAYDQANGGTTNQTTEMLATEIEEIYQELLNLANTKLDGRYLFGPEQLYTPPFDPATVLEDPPADSPPEFLMRINIGDEKEIQINTSQEVFTGGAEGKNIFQVVDALKSGLENNDLEAIQSAVEEIDQALEQTTKHLEIVGAKMYRLDQNQKILTQLKNTTEKNLSEKEDADLTAKLMDYLTKSNNYSISLSALSKILHTNLLDIIG